LAYQHKKCKLWHPKEKKNRKFDKEKIKIETLASKRKKNKNLAHKINKLKLTGAIFMPTVRPRKIIN